MRLPALSAVGAALCALTLATAAHADTTLIFGNTPGDYDSYSEGGYTIAHTGTDPVEFNKVTLVDDGSGNIALLTYSQFHSPTDKQYKVTQDGGGPFSLESVDLLFSNGAIVTFSAGDRNFTNTEFIFNNSTPPGTYTFGSQWQNISSFTITADLGTMYFDNLRLSAVPEPGNLAWLTGIGVGGMGLLARRKCAAKPPR